MTQNLIDCLRNKDPQFVNIMAQKSRKASSFVDLLRLITLRKKAAQVGLWPQVPHQERLRVAVLGGSTLFPFHELLEHYLETDGIRCSLFIGDYDNYTAEILEAGPLRAFRPEATILIPSSRRCISRGLLTDPSDIHRASAQTQVDDLLGLCRVLHETTGTEIILTNFLLPGRMDPGPFRARTLGSIWAFRKLVNLELGLQAPPYVQICDVEHLGARHGNLFAVDDRAWFESKQAFTPDMNSRVAQEAARQIRTLHQSPKKVLVMDLDNTLWGGVIGDDGLEGIELGDTSPRGEAFKAFQTYVRTLAQRGVILSVCSKNEEIIAREPFEKHPDMVLKLDDIACFKANWNPKSENLAQISAELNLGMDSLVFVDDNPAEIEIVRQFAPAVETILLGPDPSVFVSLLEDSRFFEPRSLTKEDALRTSQYRQEHFRQKLLENATDMRVYLASLEMTALVQPFTPVDTPRIAQLINKSNQFNVTTQRRTEAEVSALAGDTAHPAFTVRLADRFGDHGLIAVVITNLEPDTLDVDTWLMSCRVLKRQVEDLVVNHLVHLARHHHCKRITARYIPTPKNSMVSNLFTDMGFSLVSKSPDGCAEYLLTEEQFPERTTEIKVRSQRSHNGPE